MTSRQHGLDAKRQCNLLALLLAVFFCKMISSLRKRRDIKNKDWLVASPVATFVLSIFHSTLLPVRCSRSHSQHPQFAGHRSSSMAEEEAFSLTCLDGMAASWEGSAVIRKTFREKDSLLTWPHAVGVPSMSQDCK